MDHADFLESIGRYEAAMQAHAAFRDKVPLTHKQLLERLRAILAKVVVYTYEEVLLEVGAEDELALARRLSLVRQVREECRNDLLLHQLHLEGLSDDEINVRDSEVESGA